jgi:hypothetical protein
MTQLTQGKKLLEQMRDQIRVKQTSFRTEKTYLTGRVSLPIELIDDLQIIIMRGGLFESFYFLSCTYIIVNHGLSRE